MSLHFYNHPTGLSICYVPNPVSPFYPLFAHICKQMPLPHVHVCFSIPTLLTSYRPNFRKSGQRPLAGKRALKLHKFRWKKGTYPSYPHKYPYTDFNISAWVKRKLYWNRLEGAASNGRKHFSSKIEPVLIITVNPTFCTTLLSIMEGFVNPLKSIIYLHFIQHFLKYL